MREAEIEQRLAEIIQAHGAWNYDIRLSENIWTSGNLRTPHTRLRRIVQIIQDSADKPISECRILDLGCLDGLFAMELASQGAEVVGVEARTGAIIKCNFARDCLGLANLSFVQDDVRNVTLQNYGACDVVVCSGVLYHMDFESIYALLSNLYNVLGKLLIIDTHISLAPKEKVSYGGREYHGHSWREHADDDTEAVKAARLWASHGNDVSFWLTRPSLMNLLRHTGYSTVYECLNPPHLNFGAPGLEHRDRCTFVAVKGSSVELLVSPAVNDWDEDWPEEGLTYPYNSGA